MKMQEYAAGVAYTHEGTTILFPVGVEPKLLIGDDVVGIFRPERFGEWETSAERRAFVRAFVQICQEDAEWEAAVFEIMMMIEK
jgi:hypothetical protein